MHTTQGSYASAAAWFASPESAVSSHYLVGLDGRIAQFVDETDTAWHAGRVLDPTAAIVSEQDPNLYTIGIEFEDGGDPEGVHRTDEQYRAGAWLVAAVAARWGVPLDREHLIGHREIFAAKSCPGNLELDRLIAEAIALEGGDERPAVVALLPARNAAADLPVHLDSVRRFADAIIALDDGSIDGSAELLERDPLVRTLLSNPPRRGYGGWDDARNRERLLEAAADLEPNWVIFLDADERLDAEDAEALRGFLGADALPGCAYGLELHRMWGEDRAVTAFTWVYRLFAFERGLTLPTRRLHFNPVPVEIPRGAWVRTTIRVRHLDSPERLAERQAKYAEADPERALERRPARLLAEPVATDLRPWSRRDPDEPVLDPGRVAGRVRAEAAEDPQDSAVGDADEPRLVCLLPVRNGADDLPGYLESAASFADAVIALDDGSSDDTAEILEASPLVEEVLRNPPREDYRGWDDAANRGRLLGAASALEPDWVLFLDADERIDPDDGAALRAFLSDEAEPGCAYGFRVHRMIDDLSRYDEAGLWVYRLFAYEPGQRLPQERLHFVPVPESIDRATHWRRTTIRIQHLGGASQTRRLSRFGKYREADPERDYQSDYDHLLRPPARVRPWRPRPKGLPVLADPLRRGFWARLDLEDLDPDAPLLSAIVISRNDEDRIERAVRSVVEQDCPHPFEVIVVVSGSDRTAEIVRQLFPDVKVVELDDPALPGRARNAGVVAARGEYVSFPGSHVELPPGSLAARLAAHELGYPMVTGSILNGTPTRSGWASYFLDHSGSLPGRPSAELAEPPAHCSYAREFVLEAGGFPEHLRAGEDTVVNRALFAWGLRAYRAREVQLIHRSRCSTPQQLVRHHFGRGRGWGRIVLDEHRGGRRLLRRSILGFLLVRYLPSRLLRTSRKVRAWGGELRRPYLRALPLVVAGATAAWLGVWVEILRPERGKLGLLITDQRAHASADEDVLAVDSPRDRVLGEGGGGDRGADPAQLR